MKKEKEMAGEEMLKYAQWLPDYDDALKDLMIGAFNAMMIYHMWSCVINIYTTVEECMTYVNVDIIQRWMVDSLYAGKAAFQPVFIQ